MSQHCRRINHFLRRGKAVTVIRERLFINGGFLDGHAKWYNTIQFIGLRTSGVEMWGHYTGG